MAKDENGHGLTFREMRNEVDTFLFAGRSDTLHRVGYFDGVNRIYNSGMCSGKLCSLSSVFLFPLTQPCLRKPAENPQRAIKLWKMYTLEIDAHFTKT